MSVNVFVPVPQECMAQLIGTKGRKIKEVEQQTQTRIWACNGTDLERRSGFTVTGSRDACEAASTEINRRMGNLTVTIKKPIPHQFAHLLIRNVRQIEQESNVKINWPKFNGKEDVNFCVKGSSVDCERATGMVDTYMEKWKDNEGIGKLEYAGSQGNRVEREIKVPKEYMGLVLGKQRKNIERIETKSVTKIKVVKSNVEAETETETKEAILMAIGTHENCVRAESLIRDCIISHKDIMKSREFGGNKPFVCIDIRNEDCELQLKPGGFPPKLDGYIRGERYRIATSDDDYSEPGDANAQTVSDVKAQLLPALEKLYELKDDQQLLVDLWCHLGKILVYNVDEASDVKKNFSPLDVQERIRKVVSPTKNRNEQAYWKVSFEEGVDLPDILDGALPSLGNTDEDFFDLELVHTQWRYDFGFITPSERNVRFKAWKGLPPHSDGPPVEVKNILEQVSFRADEDIDAWICYPSTTVLKGEIMTPNSQYDCRIKLRAGSRYVTDRDDVCKEEDMILADYLSNCTFDANEDRVVLPEKENYELPNGFSCMFFRKAEERMFSATVDEERFTVIVLDETGWDSDVSAKRDQKQLGVRVVMDSWSDALLSCERKWEPAGILAKLSDFMSFLSYLKAHLFGQL